MWPVENSSALIGWNILSSLNAVISTNERNRIYNRSHGFITRLILKSYRQQPPTSWFKSESIDFSQVYRISYQYFGIFLSKPHDMCLFLNSANFWALTNSLIGSHSVNNLQLQPNLSLLNSIWLWLMITWWQTAKTSQNIWYLAIFFTFFSCL